MRVGDPGNPAIVTQKRDNRGGWDKRCRIKTSPHKEPLGEFRRLNIRGKRIAIHLTGFWYTPLLPSVGVPEGDWRRDTVGIGRQRTC